MNRGSFLFECHLTPEYLLPMRENDHENGIYPILSARVLFIAECEEGDVRARRRLARPCRVVSAGRQHFVSLLI